MFLAWRGKCQSRHRMGGKAGSMCQESREMLAKQNLSSFQKWWGVARIQAGKCKLHPLTFWQSSSEAFSSSHQQEIQEGRRECYYCQAWLSFCTDAAPCLTWNWGGVRRMGKVLHICGTVAFGSFCLETCPFPFSLSGVLTSQHPGRGGDRSTLVAFGPPLLSIYSNSAEHGGWGACRAHVLCTGSLPPFWTEPEQRSVVSCQYKCVHDDKLCSTFNTELIHTVLIPAPVQLFFA